MKINIKRKIKNVIKKIVIMRETIAMIVSGHMAKKALDDLGEREIKKVIENMKDNLKNK